MNPSQADFNPRRRVVAQYGSYAVQFDPLVHLPWGLHRVYCGERYVGAFLSFPSESDCAWLERFVRGVAEAIRHPRRLSKTVNGRTFNGTLKP